MWIIAAARYAALGDPTLYDHLSSAYGRGPVEPHRVSKKIFVDRLPQEASAEDLGEYFGRFGRILDVYVPKAIIVGITIGVGLHTISYLTCDFPRLLQATYEDIPMKLFFGEERSKDNLQFH